MGEQRYVYRWGRPREQLVDRDRDGKPEARATFSGYREFATHMVPDEMWEDWNEDGIFERHYVLTHAGAIDVLEIDTDGDGRYDETLRGDEAEAYVRNNPWPDA